MLDPVERSAEVLFGLIMALTFTCAISAAEGGREGTRTLLVGALTCNLAWGVVDGTMYLLSRLADRGAAWRVSNAFRATADRRERREILAGVLPSGVAASLGDDDLDALCAAIERRGVPAPGRGLRAKDFRGALAVFLLVTASTFPVAIPFLIMDDPIRALRVSNAVAIVMLCLVGAAYGRAAGYRPWIAALAMVALGLVLVGTTIALGG